jgi:hypothetical protein
VSDPREIYCRNPETGEAWESPPGAQPVQGVRRRPRPTVVVREPVDQPADTGEVGTEEQGSDPPSD